MTRTNPALQAWRCRCALVTALLVAACGGGGGGGADSTPPPVPAAPGVSVQPADTTVVAGQLATFSVSASGSAPLHYQWRKNGADIAGATAATYSVIPGVADNGARFSVVVSNLGGNTPSGSATLTVRSYFMLAEAGAAVTPGTITLADGSVPAKSYALAAVNPDAPATALTIAPAGEWLDIPGAQWSEGTLTGGVWSAVRSRYFGYMRGGRFYKVDRGAPAASGPTGQPWTTFTTNQMCRLFFLPDGASWAYDSLDASRSYLFVKTPGPDATCGTADDVIRALRVGMGASEDALTVAEPLTSIQNEEHSIVGFLTRSGSQVRRVDANFANPVNAFTLANAATPSQLSTFGGSAPGTLLYVDGRDVMAYRLDGSAAPRRLFGLLSGETIAARGTDASQAFLAVTGASGTRLVRVDEGLDWTTLASLPEPPSSLAFSATRVIAKGSTTVVSVPKAGGSPTVLVAADPLRATTATWVAGETAYVLMTPLGASASTQVRIVGTDATNPETRDDARFVGVFAKAPYPSGWIAFIAETQYDTIVLAEGAAGAGLAGASIRGYVGATRALRATYGVLPATPVPQELFLADNDRQTGGLAILQVLRGGVYGTGSIDMLGFNSGTAGLLPLGGGP